MMIDKIIVFGGGILAIIFTLWYFFGKKEEKEIEAKEEIEILVKGGYQPSKIVLTVNKKTKLVFLREDESSCLEEIVIPDFKIRKFLPLKEKTIIEITPHQTGVFDFSCGMGMFHGQLIVK